MSIINKLNQPNWRYKLMWLGASAAVWLLAAAGSETGSENMVLVFSFMSMCLAGSVICWYAILAMAGKLAGTYFAGRGTALTMVGEVIVAWLVTGATSGIAIWMSGLAWGQGTGLSTLTVTGLIVILFVTAMRTMDLRDETLGPTLYPPQSKSTYGPQTNQPVGYPSFGLGNEYTDGNTITIEDVPTKTI